MNFLNPVSLYQSDKDPYCLFSKRHHEMGKGYWLKKSKGLKFSEVESVELKSTKLYDIMSFPVNTHKLRSLGLPYQHYFLHTNESVNKNEGGKMVKISCFYQLEVGRKEYEKFRKEKL